MKRVLITYSWSINNIGDIAITPGLIELFREFSPESKLSVMSMYSVDNEEYPNTEKYFKDNYPDINIMPCPFINVDPQNNLNNALEIIQSKLGRQKLEDFNRGNIKQHDAEQLSEYLINQFPGEMIDCLKDQYPDFIEKLDDFGFVIYNSGTTLNFGRGEPGKTEDGKLLRQRDFWNTTLIRAMPLLLANYLKIPFAISAQSYDAIDYPANIFFTKLLSRAVFIGARDPQSLSYLKSRNIYNADMSFRPDSTFFAKGEDTNWAEEFMSKNSLRENEFITLTIRSSIQGYINIEREDTYMEILRDFIEKYTQRIGNRILLCPEVRHEIQPMNELIYSKLSPKAKENCIWMDHFWTTEQARAVYAKARTVVSMEMHSIILAIGAGTPVLHPRFMESGRKAFMLREMDMEQWLFDMDHLCPEELFSAAEEIHHDYASAKDKVLIQMQKLKLLASKSIKKINKSCL